MQDSLPAAGPALPGGIGYPQGSCERFHGCNDSPFPSFLARCQTLFLVLTCRLWCGGWCHGVEDGVRLCSWFLRAVFETKNKVRHHADCTTQTGASGIVAQVEFAPCKARRPGVSYRLDVAFATPHRLAATCQPAANGSRSGGVAVLRQSRSALRRSSLGHGHGRTIGAGMDDSASRKTEETIIRLATVTQIWWLSPFHSKCPLPASAPGKRRQGRSQVHRVQPSHRASPTRAREVIG